MKERKFKVTNITNFNDYIGTIPVKNSIAIVTEESQMRIIDRQKSLGDFNFEEIFESNIETDNINQYDVEERSENIKEDTGFIETVEKPVKRRNSGRGRPKKQ